MRRRREAQTAALDSVAAQAAELGRECTSFLDGSYLQSLCERNELIPDWAWLAALAYVPLGDLGALLADRARWSRRPELLPWLHAMRAMTEALSEAAGRVNVEAAALQRAIVVPLELLPNAVHFGPAALARAVSVAIDREVRKISADKNRAAA